MGEASNPTPCSTPAPKCTLLVPAAWLVPGALADALAQLLSEQGPAQGKVELWQALPAPQLVGPTRQALKALAHLDVAVWVLPTAMAQPKHSVHWPVPWWPGAHHAESSGSAPQHTLVATVFADHPADLVSLLQQACPAPLGPAQLSRWHVTCQQQKPYTDTLIQWLNAGAHAYHPDAVWEADFLNDLSTLQGHWLYVGQAQADSLQSYDGLNAPKLLAHAPQRSLASTFWLADDTLGGQAHTNLGLDWYRTGATQSLLAAVGSTSAQGNQEMAGLLLAGLHVAQQAGASMTLAELLRQAFVACSAGSRWVKHWPAQYRLLGNPWVAV